MLLARSLRRFCIVLICSLCVLLPVDASPFKWGFIGEGFHMHFFLEYSFTTDETQFTFDLPNSFFIDTAEAQQQYIMRKCVSKDACVDVTSHYFPLSIRTAYLCDIEAPVFRVPDTNRVVIQMSPKPDGFFNSLLDREGRHGYLQFPIHSRYEQLATGSSFSLSAFLREEKAYVFRCMNSINSSQSEPFEVVDANPDDHCRRIPVGNLADLPFVYRSLMTLLVLGAVIVVLALSF